MTSNNLTLPYSRHFLEWLQQHAVSLGLTTYQTNRLCLIGVQPNGQISTPVWEFERPMGLYTTTERFYLATRYQIWRFENILENGELLQDKYDRLYVPRVAYTTGDLDVHDVIVDPQGNIIFANTEYSCLATLHPQHSFTPIWQPNFITKLAPEDRCHLNGLAAVNSVPRYVTAVSRSDVASGWRHRRRDGGVVIDIQSNEIIARGLSMPHSPRWYQGKLWLLNSGTGDFGYIENGEFVCVTFCPGYGRGLAFVGDFAVVGLSKPRDYHFSGLLIGERLQQKEAEARCGILIIELKTGNIVEWLDMDTEATELYDVAIFPQVKCPMSVGFKSGNIAQLITIGKGQNLPEQQGNWQQPTAQLEEKNKSQESEPLTRAKREFERGQDFKKQGQIHEAITCFQQAIAAEPTYIPALNNLGTLMQQEKRFAEAISCYETVLKINPNLPQTLTNLASIYLLNGNLNQAEARLTRALQLQPDLVPALYNLGLVYKQQGKLEEAIQLFQTAAQHQPNYTEVYLQLGEIWDFQSQFTRAKLAYERVQTLNPNTPNLSFHIGWVQLNLCNWENYESFVQEVINSTTQYVQQENQGFTLAPFQLNALPIPPELSRSVAQKHATGIEKSVNSKKPQFIFSQKTDKLRVGYISPDFREHAVGRLICRIFEQHNREEFEIFGYNLLNVNDQVTDVIKSGCDEFRDLYLVSATDAAQQINQDGIDILIDLGGYTGYSKPEILAYQPAPIQAHFLGYPNTMGAKFIQYFIADSWVVPPELAPYYSEEIIDLPHQFICSPMEISNKPFTRSEEGLPETGFVFACFNQHYKITPDLFAAWIEILQQVEGSVLWLSEPTNDEVIHHLRNRAVAAGVAPERLIFAAKISHPEYLARLQLADLALDTWIYNGGSTTIAALWGGLPVLTKPGVTNASRMAASICASAGIPEMICQSGEEYQQKAVEFANNPQKLQQLRQHIKARDAPLFDVSGFVRHLEEAFRQMTG